MKNKVRNMVADLNEAELSVILQQKDPRYTRGFVGKTLKVFIEHNMLENSTLTELMEELECWNLRWPFRSLTVNAEIRMGVQQKIAVLQENLDDFFSGKIEDLSALDTKFSIDDLYDKAEDELQKSTPIYDFTVCDDSGRTIVDWG